MSEVPTSAATGSLTDLDREIAVPNEPAELVAMALRGDWDAAVAYVKANYISLLTESYATVTWLYRLMPAEVVAADPVMQTGREIFAKGDAPNPVVERPLPEDPQELEALAHRDDLRELLTVATGQAIVLRQIGLLEEAMAIVTRAEILAGLLSEPQREAVADVLATLELQWGITLQLGGDLQASVTPLQRSFTSHMRRAVEFLAGISASHAALTISMMGFNHQVDLWLQRHGDLPTVDGWIGAVAHVPADVARALEALDRLDEPAAAAALEPLRVLHQQEEFRAFVTYAFAQYELTFGHPLEGLARLDAPDPFDRGEWMLGRGEYSALLVQVSAVDLCLAAGQGARASTVLSHMTSDQPLAALSQARYSLKSNEYDAALSSASAALWDRRATPRTRAELCLIAATAEYLRGNDDRAVQELERAVAVIKGNRLLRALTTAPRLILEKLSPVVRGLPALLADPALESARDVFAEDVQVVTLTDRELQLLRDLDSTETMKQIARRQFVSLDTVRSHRLSLYRKLGAHSRSDAVIRGREWGFL